MGGGLRGRAGEDGSSVGGWLGCGGRAATAGAAAAARMQGRLKGAELLRLAVVTDLAVARLRKEGCGRRCAVSPLLGTAWGVGARPTSC